MKVLAEIPARTAPGLRPGTLRRGDLEAFGALLEGLSGAQTVLMTGVGSDRRETAAGLAAAAAAAGTRTALLECDLAEPALADALGLANAPGLHEYLRGMVEAEDVLKPVVLAGPGSVEASEPLVCVVAGRPVEDGWTLFASERFRRAIEGLRASYELVVIDGPSFRDEAALGTLAPLADATVACVESPESGQRLPLQVTGVVIQRS